MAMLIKFRKAYRIVWLFAGSDRRSRPENFSFNGQNIATTCFSYFVLGSDAQRPVGAQCIFHRLSKQFIYKTTLKN